MPQVQPTVPDRSRRTRVWSRLRRPRWLVLVVVVLVAAGGVLALNLPRADAAGVSIWTSATKPKIIADPDTKAVELGTRFRSSVAGRVTAIRFYKSAENRGRHVGTLWTASGKRLATVRFTGESATGWQQAELARPVAIKARTTYVVSYNAPRGRYSAQTDMFSGGRQINRPPLSALAGVFSYDLGFPRDSWRGSSYFVDVKFSPEGRTPTDPGTTEAPAPTTAPSPTGSPTGSPTTKPPSNKGFPDASSTGAKGALKKVDGPLTLSTPGQVLENVDIDGRVTVKADNVTLRNVRIHTGDYWALINYGKNLQVTDATLTGTVNTQASLADAEDGYTIGRRLDVSGAGDGVRIGSGGRLYDSYVHDLAVGPGIHDDGVVVWGSHDVRINGNTILNDVDQTSAIFLSDLSTSDADVVINGNLLAGAGYTIYGGEPGRGITVTGNQFSTRYFPRGGYWGPVAYWSSTGNVWSGNTWADGANAGRPVEG